MRAFASAYDQGPQRTTIMAVPYGEVSYGESVYGATARYEQPPARGAGSSSSLAAEIDAFLSRGGGALGGRARAALGPKVRPGS